MGICGSSETNVNRSPERERPIDTRNQNHNPPQNIPSPDQSLLDQICPNTSEHGLWENDLAPLLLINHPENLNLRYSYLYTMIDNKYVGANIKRTYQYASRVPMEELIKKRNEFWRNNNIMI